jgi:hypothetical protein
MNDRAKFEPTRTVKTRDHVSEIFESQRGVSPEDAGRDDAREAMSEARAVLRNAAQQLARGNGK